MLKNFLIVIILFYAQHVNANAIELTFNGLSFLGNFNQKERYQVAANFTNEDLGKFNKSLLKKIKQSAGSFNQFVIKTKAGKNKVNQFAIRRCI